MNISDLHLLMAKVPTGPLPDMPIEAEKITGGNPVARGAILSQSDDKKITCGVWSCEPGSFQWQYAWDEFIYVLEGAVTTREDGGASHSFGPGDTGHFPLGLVTHWEVTEPVRKFFVLRTPEPFIL